MRSAGDETGMDGDGLSLSEAAASSHRSVLQEQASRPLDPLEGRHPRPILELPHTRLHR